MIVDIKEISESKYKFDYIDVGCKRGSSTHLCREVLGGSLGLGIDINADHVASYSAAGGVGMAADASNLGLPDNIVNFSVLSHILEHLPNLDSVNKVISESLRVSRKFVYIVGPFFDEDEYLRSLGLKFFWSDWSYHPTHVHTSDILRAVDMSGVKCKAEVYGRIPVIDSSDKNVLDISEPRNQHQHDLKIHKHKSFVSFARPLFKEICTIVIKDDTFDLSTAREKLRLDKCIEVRDFN
jgi:hypothetical protein